MTREGSHPLCCPRLHCLLMMELHPALKKAGFILQNQRTLGGRGGSSAGPGQLSGRGDPKARSSVCLSLGSQELWTRWPSSAFRGSEHLAAAENVTGTRPSCLQIPGRCCTIPPPSVTATGAAVRVHLQRLRLCKENRRPQNEGGSAGGAGPRALTPKPVPFPICRDFGRQGGALRSSTAPGSPCFPPSRGSW